MRSKETNRKNRTPAAANSGEISAKSSVPENLREHCFKPGQSGNPSGRPKKSFLTEATQEMLEEKLSDPVERQKWKEAQWSKMLKHGVVGAMFMDAAWDRTEGKVAQPVRVSGELTVSLADEMRKARDRAKRISESE